MSATTTIELVEGSKPRAQEVPARGIATNPPNPVVAPTSAKVEKKGTTAVIITTIAGVTMISSMLNGLITISLPVIARELQISDTLLLWSVPAAQEAMSPGLIHTIQANVHLFLDLWLHAHPLWRCGRCGRPKKHVSSRYIPAKRLHPRLRAVKDEYPAYRI